MRKSASSFLLRGEDAVEDAEFSIEEMPRRVQLDYFRVRRLPTKMLQSGARTSETLDDHPRLIAFGSSTPSSVYSTAHFLRNLGQSSACGAALAYCSCSRCIWEDQGLATCSYGLRRPGRPECNGIRLNEKLTNG
jgi:hypothetical protein